MHNVYYCRLRSKQDYNYILICELPAWMRHRCQQLPLRFSTILPCHFVVMPENKIRISDKENALGSRFNEASASTETLVEPWRKICPPILPAYSKSRLEWLSFRSITIFIRSSLFQTYSVAAASQNFCGYL